MASRQAPGRRAVPRPSTPPRREPGEFENLLLGSPGKKIVTAAAVLTAGLYLLGTFKPVLESHLPSASQDDLSGVSKSLKAALDQTVATATAANQQAQQALRSSQTAQLDRLLQQRVQLETLINMNPNDTTLKIALEKTNIDINRLAATTSAEATQAVVPVAPVLVPFGPTGQ